ncbi:MAG: hypothetical protein IJ184_00740 [Alphaproteobacteria bacterium]|nr:hypothetical protein [Alphaproteobacteria bacterium]
MMEFWHNFHFLRPWLLLLALLPLIAYHIFARQSVLQSSWRQVIDERLLRFLLIKGSAPNRKFYLRAGLIGMLSAIIAAAGPSWQKVELPLLQKQNPVVLMLNLSQGLDTSTADSGYVTRAKYQMQDFLRMLTTIQISLGVYSVEPFIILPFTEDSALASNLLQAVASDIMPANGDRLDRAIELAVQRLQTTGFAQGSIVIFTSDVGQKFDLALAQAKQAAARNYQINIFSPSSDYNEKLQMIAQAGAGSYRTLSSGDDYLSSLASAINEKNAPSSESKNQTLQWLDNGYYLLIFPLLCCLLLFRRGLLIWVVLLSASPAYAGFFTNADQDGLKSFNAGDFAAAAADFRSPQWQAASYYRLGDYAKSYQLYLKDSSPEGLYNQGNALAKSGQISQAIAKYEEVLEQVPDHEDAKFNLEYLKQQQNQSSTSSYSSSSSSSSDDQSENDQNSSQGASDNSSDNNTQDSDQNSNDKNSASGSSENHTEDNADNADSSSDADAANGSSSSADVSEEQSDTFSGTEPTDTSGNTDQSSGNAQPDSRSAFSGSAQESSSDSASSGEESSALSPQSSSPQGAPSEMPLSSDNDGFGEEYDEKTQAKLQQYREIPEDTGGLLRALIRQEYQKNRYNEKQ